MWNGCSLFKMELEDAKAAGRVEDLDRRCSVSFRKHTNHSLLPTNSTNLSIDQLSFNLRWESLNTTIQKGIIGRGSC